MKTTQAVRITPLALVLLLVGCISPSWNGVVLPESNVRSVSPHLNWVTYDYNDELWLASLPDLERAVRITEANDTSLSWSMHTWWMPDGTGFLIRSRNRAECTETWWLVKTDDLEARSSLCTLPIRERLVNWSPTNNAFVTIDRGGTVTLVHADGSGCEELPIPGLIMLTPTISWSPDGQKIAYLDMPRGELGAAELRYIDLNTYQTATIYADASPPEWFPDGEAIALMGWGEVIPVVRADGSGMIGEIEVPEGYEIDDSRGYEWLPDGSRLALYLENEGPDYEPVAIGILDRDTLDISVFEVPHFSRILGWTPDGSAVVVLASGDDESWVLREEDVSPWWPPR